jgi:HME family heavy-metal exporter
LAFLALLGVIGILYHLYKNLTMIEEGMTFNQALIIQGAKDRLSPVLMTALTASLALLPVLLQKHQAGSEILYPVAVVIVGGLLTSTLIDSFMTPVWFYHIFKKSKV